MVDPNSALGRALAARTEERLRLALRAGDFGVWEWDIETGQVTWSEEIYRFLKLSPDGFSPDLGSFLNVIYPDDRAQVQSAINDAVENNTPYHVVFRVTAADEEVRWLEGWGQVIRDSEATPLGMIGLVTDATQRVSVEEDRAELLRREREARAEAEAGRQRMAFLNQAFKVLGVSLEVEATTDRVLNLLVPHLGDWAVIYLNRNGRVEPIGAKHRDPEKAKALDSLVQSTEVRLDTPGGAGEVIRTGSPILQAHLPEELLDEIGLTDDQRRQVDEIGVGSYIVVPLSNQRESIGAMAVGVGMGARPYSADDLEVAEQLAFRAGAALYNSSLFAERTSIAKVLQRSLLPAAFPKISGCELAGGYRSAGSGLDVGGDFYDVFQISGGRFGVAIGDVSGKGHEAAAVTALTRHTIRATAMLREEPDQVLEAVNDVLLDQTVESRFCTAAFGIVQPHEGGLRLRLARAGHLPPLVAHADGRIEALEADGVLLGMFPDIELENISMELEPGDVLVMYTDGLTDVQVGGGVLGDDWLRSELAVARKLPAADIATKLETSIVRTGEALVDDVAILVLKVSERD